MKPKEYLALFALAALWGASFLFIKVAVADMSPLTLVAVRLVFGTLGLVVVIVSNWWPGGERLTWPRFAGVLVGFLGVVLLIGPAAIATGRSSLYLLGAFSILIGAASYALGGLFARRMLSGLPLMQPAIGQTAMGAFILAPIASIALVVQPPTHLPSSWAIASVLALALGGTSLAYIFYFWLIEHVGPTRTLIVTYLLPCFALVYGAVLLHESVGINAIAGLALVLAGIFVTGRKTPETQITEKTRREQQTHA